MSIFSFYFKKYCIFAPRFDYGTFLGSIRAEDVITFYLKLILKIC